MKNLGICAIILVLGVLGPQNKITAPYAPVWMLGLLVLLAFLGEQWGRQLRLPPLVGWLAAGLVLGPVGLHVVFPPKYFFLQFFQALAAVWLGFQVGLGLRWSQTTPAWRIPALSAAVTLTTCLLTALALTFFIALPWWLALLLGALASFWGPFTTWALGRSHRTLILLGSAGNGAALITLSILLLFLHQQQVVEGASLVGRLWLTLLAGALSAEILYRLDVFGRNAATALIGLTGCFALAALTLLQLHLYALPFGFGAGLVIALRRQVRQVRQALAHLDTAPSLLFFALAGATLNPQLLWPPQPGLYETAALLVLIMAPVRFLGVAVWNPLPAFSSRRQRQLGLLLLPHGALLFELLYHPAGGLGELIEPAWETLLHQVLLLDILIATLVFSPLAILISGFARRTTFAHMASAHQDFTPPP